MHMYIFKKFLATGLLFLFTFGAYADEGMWLPMLVKRLNHTDMQKYGLQLSPEEIYSINQSSLKDAIVSFGGFCTGEMISAQGLLLTNHHCGYGAIQSHSNSDKNFLKEGFWAMEGEHELPNNNLYARFLIRMEDVTKRVLAQLNDQMSEDERAHTIAELSKKIAKESKGDTHYDVVVKEFFSGNEFYLFVYETFNDVRLVGAPPESIGKFGGDTDTWKWPRHTGDFALFRVYSSPEGKPAEYSEKNIPLTPKHHLPVSLQGVKEGDFTMVMGYPGSTDRYITSFGVRQELEQSNPTRVKIRDKRLEILKEDMDANLDIRIKYASKYANINNYWKYFIGQSKGLQSLNVLEKKQALEKEFKAWAAADSQRNLRYGKALELVAESYEESYEENLSYLYFTEAALGTEIIRFANSFRGLESALAQETKNQERIKGLLESLSVIAENHFKDYSATTDRKVMAALLQMYYEDVPQKDHPEIFKTVIKEFKGDFEHWVNAAFEQSIFDEEDKVKAFLQQPDLKTLQNDPAYRYATSFIDNYYKNVALRMKEIDNKRDKGNRLFVQGLREMQPDRKFYPNANATMRLSFGQVLSYEARDGVAYNYFTTLEGVMEKMDQRDPEFRVPPKLSSLFSQKNYGRYANEDGEMTLAFITNNDITGGSSGSPVIDGQGHLVGTAFDSNWEAMSGDIAFEPDLQRCINVDIRYILFIIDKFAGAGHLLDEMTIIHTSSNNEITTDKSLKKKGR